MIRAVEPKDVAAVTEIYNHYVEKTIATFEEEPVSQIEMAGRIEKCMEQKYPFIVLADGDNVVAYAYAGPFHPRAGYRFSTELSVYTSPEHLSKGNGSKLYAELINLIKQGDYRMAYGGIGLPNDACVRLHEKLGFKKVAHFSKVGYKLETWVDVGYWEIELKST